MKFSKKEQSCFYDVKKLVVVDTIRKELESDDMNGWKGRLFFGSLFYWFIGSFIASKSKLIPLNLLLVAARPLR
jgi:hypothetical protein